VILDDIIAYKRQELEGQKRAVPLRELKARVTGRRPPLDFATALRGRGVRLIAEIKKASPSKGVLRPDLNPVQLAETYATNGAAAISVLTDRKFFQGDLESLRCIKSQLSHSQHPRFGPRDASTPVPRHPIPILRKDFIFDPYQVYETCACGADALLLIVAVLSDGELRELLDLAHDLGMTALVEVHDETELERALSSDPRVLGVNNRDLYDFSVDLDTFGRLRPLIPPNIVAVAESGVRSAADVRRIGRMGADAVLVGEALVTAPNVSLKVRELVEGGNQITRGRGR
jgi:indole-3-glycerol phosphate synthase